LTDAELLATLPRVAVRGNGQLAVHDQYQALRAACQRDQPHASGLQAAGGQAMFLVGA